MNRMMFDEPLNKTSKNITQLLKEENNIGGNNAAAKNRKHQLGITPSASVGGPIGMLSLVG